MNQFAKRTTFFTNSSGEEQKNYSDLRAEFTSRDSLMHPSKLLYRAAKKFKTDVALLDPASEHGMTYQELFLRSVSFSKLLQDSGIGPRDRVVLLSENSLSFYVAYFGIWQTGAIAVPLNVFLHDKELAYVLNDAQPKVVVASSKLAAKVTNLIEQGTIERPPAVLTTDDDIDYDTPVEQLSDEHKDFQPVSLGIEELTLLLYTSGTTGQPKGVMLSGRNIMVNALQSFARLTVTLTPRERVFCVLPLFHVFAQNVCIWLPMISGGSVVVVPQIDRKQILKGLAKKPTIFVGVPALYGLLCLMKDAPLETVKMFVSGADALPDKIRAAFALIYGRKIAAGYGLTEASPVVAVYNQNGEQQTCVVGQPVCDLECDIRDDDGAALGVGEIGTLWVRGQNVMMGYYKAQEATDKVIKDGWLNTGDLASFDSESNLSIRGRSKDLIISKGFNIYPQEIENALMQHPEVTKVAVVGKQDDAVGQIPVAFVAVKDASKEKEVELRQFCSKYLAGYKIPKSFICSEDLPMNATGKVDKKKLHLPE